MVFPDVSVSPLHDEDVVLIACHPWRGSEVALAERLARHLAATNRVVFVEPPPRFSSIWKRGRSSAPSSLTRRGRLRRVRNGPGRDVLVFTPPPLLPCPSSPQAPFARLLLAANASITAGALTGMLDERRISRPVLVCCDAPRIGCWVRPAVRPKMTAYYAGTSACLAEPGPAAPDGTPDADLDFAAQADVVVTTSDARRRRYATENPAVYVLPAGIDFDLFHRGTSLDPSSHRPCVGFVGTFDDSVDAELIRRVSADMPACDFLFVGPLDHGPVQTVLDAIPNATVLGARLRHEIPMWMRMIDVCLLPFRPGTPQERVHRHALQCLAAGKPVVAHRSVAPRDLSAYVRAATSTRTFPPHIRAALHADPRQRRLRIDYARAYDWAAQLRRFSCLLRLHLSTHPVSPDDLPNHAAPETDAPEHDAPPYAEPGTDGRSASSPVPPL